MFGIWVAVFFAAGHEPVVFPETYATEYACVEKAARIASVKWEIAWSFECKEVFVQTKEKADGLG